MTEETILFNFRIPPSLKSTFDLTCRLKNVSMTSQLNILIHEHVNKEVWTLKKEEWEKQAKDEPIDFLSSNEDFNHYFYEDN